MNYSVKGRPFLFKGVNDISDYTDFNDAISASNLAYQVEKKPAIFIKEENGFMESVPVKDYYITYRTDTQEPLGIVGKQYKIVQNNMAFTMLNELATSGAIEFDTAGSFDNGAVMFISAKINSGMINMPDSPIDNYFVFMNSHDGTCGVKILITPIRMICQNVMQIATKKALNNISLRHTVNVNTKIHEATRILSEANERIGNFKQICESLYKKNMSYTESCVEIAKFVLTADETVKLHALGYNIHNVISGDNKAMEDCGISTRKYNIITGMMDYLENGIGQYAIRGTAWGTLNAVTGYYSNVANMDGEKRMQSLLYGNKANKIVEFTNLLLAA